MVNICCVVGCSHRSLRDKCSFSRIPKVVTHLGELELLLSKDRRNKFLNAVHRKGCEAPSFTRICSCHFPDAKPAKLQDTLNPNWIPSLNLGYATRTLNSDRYNRNVKRLSTRPKVFHEPALNESRRMIVTAEEEETHAITSVETGVHCQTDLTIMEIEALQAKVFQLNALNENLAKRNEELLLLLNQKEKDTITYVQNENSKCEARIFEMELKLRMATEQLEEMKSTTPAKENEEKQLFAEKSLKGCPELLQFYTGVHEWTVFEALFELVEPLLHGGRKLSKFQKFVMFFLKIRLHLLDQDIAYRFDVHRTSIVKLFHQVLHALFCATKELISWPSRDTLRSTMPLAFKAHFKKCAVIIDCTEIFIQRPKNLEARAQVWSHYKGHSTVKFLIGITPQGTISFLSSAWGGRASDQEITETSDLLNLLLPGDMVLADRGFTIADYAGLVCAEVITPAFTRGKPQLSEKDVDWTRAQAKVRIHIEQVIGLVKNKFLILKGTLPISFLFKQTRQKTTMDELMHVCCVLANLSGPIVPSD